MEHGMHGNVAAFPPCLGLEARGPADLLNIYNAVSNGINQTQLMLHTQRNHFQDKPSRHSTARPVHCCLGDNLSMAGASDSSMDI